MVAKLSEDLIYEILSVVDEIPKGKVASYGQIAKLIDRPKNARLVGKVLSQASYYGAYPCHRVVNHAGDSPQLSLTKRTCYLMKALNLKNQHMWT